MQCTVGVVRSRIEKPKLYSISVPPSDMGQGLKGLLESEIGCDIAFKVGDETFKAHKLVLAARSPVFRAQFFGLVGDRAINEIVVEDIEPSIFKVNFLSLSQSTSPLKLCCSHIYIYIYIRILFLSCNCMHFF